ncbi:MAG: TVP38/TMEM64 family protein [Balneolaceae bacterium]|nr:TVP38/TMEM64 family protein [Balneolaceae bacterium]MBO6546391.1 TVP38/TMEM64 family protein [Balneolaceae bacterium]MBO6648750.1 TVP38/TMEM64 family protein [Balneolaceae bacterium]
MKALIKFVILLGAFFTFTLLLFKVLGILSVEDIRYWLEQAMTVSPWIVGLIIVALMLIDLFIAIPTLSLTILSGFFLGMELGVFYSTLGMLGAGTMGYVISRFHGEKLLKFVSKDQDQIEEMRRLFTQFGPFSLMLCRAAPMLPEVTSCLAGVTKMPFWKYILFYSIGTIPYSIIAAYSGSVSTIDDPSPAIFTFIGIFGGLSLVWAGFLYFNKKKLKEPS